MLGCKRNGPLNSSRLNSPPNALTTPPPVLIRTLPILLVLGLLSVAPSKLRADSLILSETYQMRIWNAKDGLENRSLNATTSDDKNYLWLATLGGLIRFDGSEFDELHISKSHRPRGNNIRTLTSTRDGELILQPTSGKILVIRNRATEVHPASQLVEGRAPRNMYCDRAGALWISVEDGSVLRWTPDRHAWFLPSENEESPVPFASFAEDGDQGLWIRTNRLFGIYKDGKFAPARIEKPLLLGEGIEGRIIAVYEDRLAEYSHGTTTTLATNAPWATDPSQITKLVTDEFGTIWIAAGRFGLLHWENGKILPAPENFNLVSDVFKDKDGLIWASSHGNGLGRITRRSTKLINKTQGLLEDVSTSVYLDSENAIWIANANGGLYKIVEDHPRKIDLIFQNKPLPVNALSLDSQRTLWLGNTSGLYRSQFPYHSVEKLPQVEGEVHLIFNASNDDLWFATTYGRFGASSNPAVFGYIRAGKLTFLNSDDGYNGRAIETIEELANGEIWAGTYDGDLMRYRDGKLETLLSGGSVTDLYADPQGRLWIATISDLYLYQNDEFQKLDQRIGMPIRHSHSINEDADGYLWFGLYRVEKAKVLEALAGERDRVFLQFVPSADSSMDFDFLINWFPNSQVDAQGKLWMATSSGILVFDSKTVSKFQHQPQAYLDSFKVNDQRVATDELVEIPPSPHRIEADFSIPYFSNAKNIQIRHRLYGADTDWVKTERNHSISYSALAPGNYTLQFEVGSIGRWNEQPVSIPIYVRPHWWQTLWFRLAGAIVAALALTLIVKRWSQHRLQLNLLKLEQEQALERERTRIARDLHDDLGGGLTALQLQADRIARDSGNGKQDDLQRLAKRARQLNADVHSIVWLFTPGDGTIKSVAELIQRYAQDIFKKSGIQIQISDPFTLPETNISSEAQHNIFLATKEALTNALKHSQANQLQLEFNYAPPLFTCSITDNGIGFSDTSHQVIDGNGLPNMRTRMQEIGGTIEIASHADHGTKVTINYDPNSKNRPKTSSR